MAAVSQQEGEDELSTMLSERGISSGRKFDPNDPCTYSRIKKYSCSVHGDTTGNPIQKCERTEQLLRRCPGRPVEVVESMTEYTEGDPENGGMWESSNPIPAEVPRLLMDSKWSRRSGERGEGSDSLSSSPVPPSFSQRPEGHPGGLFGAFEDLVRETEDMAQSFLHIFGLNGDDRSGNPFDRWFGGDLSSQERTDRQRPEFYPSNPPTPATGLDEGAKSEFNPPMKFTEV